MTSLRCILDKPLNQLTEDDISQLTREDCRKFLKDKGMRRPSWNKSQAIQQVISLKALLEGHGDDDSGAKTLRKIVVSSVENPPLANSNSNSPDSAKELSAGASVSELADEAVPYRRKDLPESVPHGDVASAGVDLEKNTVSPRNVGAEEVTLGQMTIFYCGKVNVYDRVSPDKARTIMQLAASPIPLPLDDSSNGSAAIWSLPCHMQATSDNLCLLPPRAMVSHTTQTDMEGHVNRKVRLQKYFDKRKDRGRFKSRKDVGTASLGFEMFLNQKRLPVPEGQLSKNTRTCAPQPGMANGKNSQSFC
ncbi:protein TIFY 4B isoform X1 [Rhodamnia argentea]|uniref:Protein TIFY n=1 Tax=Rhodamnia argentea TaxID=178133 RepID=A0A8B8QA11_9MYRT|nr:protein TIFY 4B isoform X1 [Rhodamnia argentea]XP_030543364.1 protein TIFY 4B isoform X1 [Rhodamnia argentea]